MKKILFSLVALMCTMSMTAQVMKIKRNGTVVYTYKFTDADEVVFEDGILHPGNFSVASGKTVKFTKSNLYWDGSAFKFEAKPTDYPTTRPTNHIGHFFWGKTAEIAYASSFNFSQHAASDKFFADGSDAAHKLTVEGKSGLYILSRAEWDYLFNTRTNAANLRKFPVTVNDGSKNVANCLIIAPDGAPFNTSTTYYTLDQLDDMGYVCIPPAGALIGGTTKDRMGEGIFCWSSTPLSIDSYSYMRAFGWYHYENNSKVELNVTDHQRSLGMSLRAVRANN